MKNVTMITRSTSMPIIDAASRSNDVARIALPVCVRRTNPLRKTISTSAPTTTMICATATCTPLGSVKPFDQSEPLFQRVAVVALVLRAEHELRGVLEEERDPERGDQRRDAWSVTQPPVREALDHHAEQAAAEHRADQHQHEQQRDVDRECGRAAEDGDQSEADERADHEDVAVREVQQLEDPVDHRVAEGDQGVDAALGDAHDQLGDEEVPVHRDSPC